MYKHFFSLLLTLAMFGATQAQNPENESLLKINDQNISRAEFERIYTKNNPTPSFDKKSLDEYMDLFINFKLKVMEAEALKMDTLKEFINELKGYRAQLEKPYFTDSDADEALMKEAYERMKWDIRASHILIKCSEDALPADTLKAYNEIKNIRKKALKGDDFATLARQYSQDPSAQTNGGDLGFFSAFSMVYEFETAAYTTPVGQISDIIRTRFGYHIVKVTDKRADPGQVRVAHIMRGIPQNSKPEKEKEEELKINQIYDSIMAGADFADMARKYSDDKGTSAKGGELPFFGAGRMIPEFEKAAFAIPEINGVSKPIRTSYGWHIIKLLETKPLGTYEETKPTISSRISKDVRAQRGREMVLAQLKKEYNVREYPNALKPFYQLIDSTIYIGKWNPEETRGLNQVLFTIADTNKYTQQDFIASIRMDGLRRVKKPAEILVNEEYQRYLNRTIFEFERGRLEVKYPEFRYLVKEYHDGILLFNLTDKMVWSKAVEDTAGLEKFYNENKNNYLWGDRVEATVYTFNQANMQDKIKKLATTTVKKKQDYKQEVDAFLTKVHAKDTSFVLTVSKAKFSKGDNPLIDTVSWEVGLKEPIVKDGQITLIYINRMVTPEPKLLNEAKGLITADYQNYLEKEWIKSLRAKYSIKVNQDVFNQMIK